MSTKSRNYRLHSLSVRCPSEAIFVHVVRKHALRLQSETVKVFSVSVSVKVDAYPVSSGLYRLIGVDNDHRRSCVDIGQFVAGENSSINRAVFLQNSIDDVAVHLSWRSRSELVSQG